MQVLERQIAGVAAVLPKLADAKGWEVKAYEDALDAMVCAWVTVCGLDGRAKPFDGADAGIWIPALNR